MPRAPFQVLVLPFRKNRHGDMEILNTRYLKELISHIGKVSQVAEKKVNPRLEQQNEKHLKKRIFQRLRDTINVKNN